MVYLATPPDKCNQVESDSELFCMFDRNLVRGKEVGVL